MKLLHSKLIGSIIRQSECVEGLFLSLHSINKSIEDVEYKTNPSLHYGNLSLLHRPPALKGTRQLCTQLGVFRYQAHEAEPSVFCLSCL